MTLRERIADARRSGVFDADAREAQEVAEVARELGFAVADVDVGDAGKTEVLARFAEALRFPAWFGHNWDALLDCLADLGWLGAPGYVVVVRGLAELRARTPEAADALREIVEEAVVRQAAAGRPLWALFVVSPSAPTC